MKPRDIFSRYYETNFWRDKESVSGPGSNLKNTEAIRAYLPPVFAQLGINSLLDLPCGDFYWFWQMWSRWSGRRQLELKYIGGDIVPQLIFDNRERYLHPNLQFEVLDAVHDRLPKVDMILCRDMLGHLPNADIVRSIKNFQRSGARYLLATTFPNWENKNIDIRTGEWRPINLSDWRFGLGEPILLLDEHQKGKFNDKSLGLWELKND